MFGTKKGLCVLAIILVMALCAAGCARTSQLTKPAADEGADSVEVTGECSAELVNGSQSVVVSGTCNLMNGTNGIVSVLNANGTTVEKRKFVKESDDMTFEFSVDDSWPAVVYGFISFDTQQCDRQPDEVTEAYGRKFQNLEGPNVIWDAKGVIAVFQSNALELPSAQTGNAAEQA